MAAVKTKQPTGLAIKRNKHVYTLTWKIGDKDYADGQACIFRCNNEKWTNETVGVKTTSKAVAVDYTKYYPRTSVYLKKVYFGVRGNRKAYTEEQKISGKKVNVTIDPTMSAWSYKEFEFNAPQAPSISSALSGTHSNVCTFSWSAKNEVQSHTHFADCEYQSVLVKESIVTDGSKLSWKSSALGWQTGTSGATGSVTITEQTELLAAASYTRWVRVRARGCRGASGWKYAKHVYARPFQARIKTATVKQTNAGGYLCTVEWSADANASHPIDKVTVQYALAVPMPGMVCPDGASWTDAGVLNDTTGIDKAAFSVDTTVGDDQCLFVRVNAEHDTNITYGAAKAATTGYLADPTDLSVTTSDSTHRATVTATNVSDVADSYLLIRYTSATYPKGLAIGIIPHGQTSATIQCPTWASDEAVGFSVQAVVGAYVTSTGADSVTVYTVTEKMRSRNRLTYGGSVPVPPSNVSLAMTDTVGTIQVTFDWAWQAARAAELSWANHADAWQSTDEPDTYVIDNTNASVWNISGLEVGQTWYVRVRLVGGTEDNPTYGGYSDTVSIDLASEPITPVLTLSSGVITDGGTVTASWVYVSTDTTLQAYAEVAEYDGEDYTVIASTETAQNVTINASEVGWSTGEEHALVVRVVSASGRETGWSEPVSVMVAEPLTCVISATSLETEIESSEAVHYLTEMPLTATVLGAGEETTMLSIIRAESYHVTRPDESDIYSFEGETIALITQLGEAQITINRDDLIGRLDDGAAYRLVATVQDGLGQSASAEIPFTVRWSHQAKAPTGTVTIDADHLAAKLTPNAPSGVVTGDTCDIYRLSVDRPQLVYEGATYGQTYVDPYPAVGDYGGYRFVMRTVDGDYITADNELAWVDVEASIDSNANIIDFDGGRVMLEYNPDVSNSWKKDFKETKYLGGSVQGDWNPAVSRTSSVGSVAVVATDRDTIEAMRRLAMHAGICHVRTRDGSSYAADVQVSESYSSGSGNKLAEFSLSITRVDPDGLDGMTLAEWNAVHTGG